MNDITHTISHFQSKYRAPINTRLISNGNQSRTEFFTGTSNNHVQLGTLFYLKDNPHPEIKERECTFELWLKIFEIIKPDIEPLLLADYPKCTIQPFKYGMVQVFQKDKLRETLNVKYDGGHYSFIRN